MAPQIGDQFLDVGPGAVELLEMAEDHALQAVARIRRRPLPGRSGPDDDTGSRVEVRYRLGQGVVDGHAAARDQQHALAVRPAPAARPLQPRLSRSWRTPDELHARREAGGEPAGLIGIEAPRRRCGRDRVGTALGEAIDQVEPAHPR